LFVKELVQNIGSCYLLHLPLQSGHEKLKIDNQIIVVIFFHSRFALAIFSNRVFCLDGY